MNRISSIILTSLLTLIHQACGPERDCANIPVHNSDEPHMIHIAAERGDLAALKRVMKEKIDVNLANKWGWTPLYFSVINGHHDAAQFLLNEGACVNIRGKRGGHTPLHYAASYGLESISSLLIAGGSGINIKDHYENTSLHHAVSGNHAGIIKLLISKKADLNIRNNRGSTPLHISVWENNAEITALLIQNGADIDQTDLGNKTPYDLAMLKGNKIIIDLFPTKIYPSPLKNLNKK